MHYEFPDKHTDWPEQICYSGKDQSCKTAMIQPAGANSIYSLSRIVMIA